jgi:hypothetical protein
VSAGVLTDSHEQRGAATATSEAGRAVEAGRMREPGEVFIPIALDEAGLKPREFRVFCHVARHNEECFESVATIARVCVMHRGTVQSALKVLVKRGLLRRFGWHPRYKTAVYRVGSGHLSKKPPGSPVQKTGYKGPQKEKVPKGKGGRGAATPHSPLPEDEQSTIERCWAITDHHDLHPEFVEAFIEQHKRDGWTVRNKATHRPEPIRNLEQALVGFCGKLESDRDGC